MRLLTKSYERAQEPVLLSSMSRVTLSHRTQIKLNALTFIHDHSMCRAATAIDREILKTSTSIFRDFLDLICSGFWTEDKYVRKAFRPRSRISVQNSLRLKANHSWSGSTKSRPRSGNRLSSLHGGEMPQTASRQAYIGQCTMVPLS